MRFPKEITFSKLDNYLVQSCTNHTLYRFSDLGLTALPSVSTAGEPTVYHKYRDVDVMNHDLSVARRYFH